MKNGYKSAMEENLLFAGVFIQENLLHSVFDRYNEMSCKQWLLMSVLKAFDTPPDLSTVAKAMGCSRQNVKQLARPLEQEGYIRLENQRQTQGVCAFLILKKANNSVKRIQRKGNLFTKLFSVNLPKMKSTFIIPCQLR